MGGRVPVPAGALQLAIFSISSKSSVSSLWIFLSRKEKREGIRSLHLVNRTIRLNDLGTSPVEKEKSLEQQLIQRPSKQLPIKGSIYAVSVHWKQVCDLIIHYIEDE